MAYEKPDIREYAWTDATFGATTVPHLILGPKGKVGFVRDIVVEVAVTLVGTTTVPEVNVGIASGDPTYGRYRLGSTAIAGYAAGIYSASDDPAITGNPPRTAQDYPNHINLDGYPFVNVNNNPGGSSSTVALGGRIPAAGMVITNVINGTGNVPRIFLRDPIPYNLAVNQVINVVGVQGATGTNGVGLTVGLINLPNNYIELGAGTFGGTYTGGGVINPVVTVTNKAGVGGTPAGGGTVRVSIQWIGVNVP